MHFFFSTSIQCTCAVILSLPKLCSLLSHGSSSACRKLARWHLHYSSKREFVVVESAGWLPVLKPNKNLGHVQACPDLQVIQLSCHPEPTTGSSASSVPGYSINTQIFSSARLIRARFTGD